MINNVSLTGRLTRDVDLRYTQSGTAVGSFTLAVDRQFTNAQGQRETDFINCVIWRKSAENFSNFTRKGSLVGVEGHIQTRTYDNAQGQRVYVTEVVVENFALLESKATTQARPSEPATGNNQQAGGFGQQSQPNFGGQPAQQAPQTPNFGAPASSASSNRSAASAQPDNSADPFANNGKTIDISDDDLPF
ncbi:single-stranded DNA-binding protein [Lacticaseibacillus jixianensis]|uniref:Single-stranded DNA-binding protein n=1 Tax=Lacticaseibacillus jixianensis TaxID=2486012 RepID=A0ABW4B8S7_9LACO|nr:single-stranded DNA-binding protein [Lacticaseibacillus jixianensis]